MSFLEVLVQKVFLKTLSLEEAIESSVRKPVPKQEEILAVHEILSNWKTELLDFSNFALSHATISYSVPFSCVDSKHLKTFNHPVVITYIL
jgi:hypothetical protein